MRKSLIARQKHDELNLYNYVLGHAISLSILATIDTRTQKQALLFRCHLRLPFRTC